MTGIYTEGDFLKLNKYKFIKQTDEKDCALASLNMLLIHMGENISLDNLKKLCNYKNKEMNFYDLHLLARKLNYESEAYYLNSIDELYSGFYPCIAQIKIIVINYLLIRLIVKGC